MDRDEKRANLVAEIRAAEKRAYEKGYKTAERDLVALIGARWHTVNDRLVKLWFKRMEEDRFGKEI